MSMRRGRSLKANGSCGSSSGSACVDTDGVDVGVVEDVEAGVGNDVLVIKTDTDVHRLPMARDYVTAIDIPGGTLTVTPWQEESV